MEIRKSGSEPAIQDRQNGLTYHMETRKSDSESAIQDGQNGLTYHTKQDHLSAHHVPLSCHQSPEF